MEEREAPAAGTFQVTGTQQITNFHYRGIRFEKPKDFVEFPKMVSMTGYEAAVAHDAGEEVELLARPPRQPILAKGRKIISSNPIQFQSIPPAPVAQTPIAAAVPLAWWRQALLWLAHKLEALAKI
jgi:hypothetical protein